MNILLTNDDGYHAKGLQLLRRVMANHSTWIVAPDGERSAISHAITLWDPLRAQPLSDREYIASGTPTDCAYLGLHGLLSETPDCVLSGVNHGPNLGIDVLYSGTVAAAMEAARINVPAMALSLATHRPEDKDWKLVEERIPELFDLFVKLQKDDPSLLLNVNFPPLRAGHTPKIRLTRLGEVVYPQHIDEKFDPRGRPYYWIGGKPPTWDTDPETDCGCILAGDISVTPLKLDITHTSLLQKLRNQLS